MDRRIQARRIDPDPYAWRHLIGTFFCKPKEFERTATRARRTGRSFEAMIHLAAAVLNSR